MKLPTQAIPAGADWSALCPRCVKPHELRDTQDETRPLVSVLVPRFRNQRLQWLSDRMQLGPVRLKLDAVGSFVWLHCDGRTPVLALGEALVSEFGAAVEPVEERLTSFLAQLHRGRLVELAPEVQLTSEVGLSLGVELSSEVAWAHAPSGAKGGDCCADV